MWEIGFLFCTIILAKNRVRIKLEKEIMVGGEDFTLAGRQIVSRNIVAVDVIRVAVNYNELRREILQEISKKLPQIQNAGLGEFQLRDLNDQINLGTHLNLS